MKPHTGHDGTFHLTVDFAWVNEAGIPRMRTVHIAFDRETMRSGDVEWFEERDSYYGVV